jgi:hypothetical protein
MLKNTSRTKSANIESIDDYRVMLDIANPYTYNFGTVNSINHTDEFRRLQNKVNFDIFTKR